MLKGVDAANLELVVGDAHGHAGLGGHLAGRTQEHPHDRLVGDLDALNIALLEHGQLAVQSTPPPSRTVSSTGHASEPSTGRTLRRVGAQLRIDVRGGTLAEVQVNVCHVHGAVIIQVIAVLV